MSELKVVPIENGESGENVIKYLEQCLEMARQGGIDNLAVVMTCTNGAVLDCWANGNNRFAIIGGIEALKHEFISKSMSE